MKRIIYLLLLVLSTGNIYGQQLDQEVQPQFNNRFESKSDKQDLIRLRDFLEEKDAEYKSLKQQFEQLPNYNVYNHDSLKYEQGKAAIEDFITRHPGLSDPYKAAVVERKIREICAFASDGIVVRDSTGAFCYNIEQMHLYLEQWLTQIKMKDKLSNSLENISKDRQEAAKAIQRIYNVEKGDQDYKTIISLYYAIIIFILIVISFYFLFKKSSAQIGNDFLNGNGLQFIALFAIIISTILFGILGILEGKELAAILSGISGFILGKGLNVNLTNKPTNPDGGNNAPPPQQ